jgi:predicted transcriptional regulator
VKDSSVLDRDQVVGILVRQDLVNALGARDGRTSIANVMQRKFPTLDEATDLEAALNKFQAPGIATIPVTHFGRLVGLLTQENLQEWIALGNARKRKQQTGPAVERDLADSGLWQHPRSFVARP